MQKREIIKLFLFFSVAVLFAQVKAEIAAPNYDFSLDSLAVFHPGSNQSDIEKKYGKGELYENGGSTTIYKFYVAHIRYRFPVFVQISDSKVFDFFARLPSYFLHDVFHQSLINRMGKQNKYLKKHNSAVYTWNNHQGKKFYYSGSCTITCFPLYYYGMPAKGPKSTPSLMDKFAVKFD